MYTNIVFSKTDSYKKLLEHYNSVASKFVLNHLFENDSARVEKFSIDAENLYYDYSKNLINQETLNLLLKLTQEYNLKEIAEKMFAGEKINMTEDRQVLHTALRDPHNLSEDNSSVLAEGIKKVHSQFKKISADLINKKWLGYSGKPITDIVNIGIGGQDLGVKMAIEALKDYQQSDLKFHFINNIDESCVSQVLATVNPETCLFIISSKSFKTPETQINAKTVKKWFLKYSQEFNSHFLAVTMNIEKAKEFGFHENNIIQLDDFAGGRFSIWGATALPLVCAIGYENFLEFLNGGFVIDQHFLKADYKQNIPVIMALISIWYNNFFNFHTHAILPYEDNLKYFVDYLQQLQMESNGKNVDREGEMIVDYHTSPIIFGNVGNNIQHSFLQLFHQGTTKIPVDLIVSTEAKIGYEEHHQFLSSSAIAQAMALMQGKDVQMVTRDLLEKGMGQSQIKQIAPHKVFMGNRPSSIILFKKLSPKILGELTSIYEHKVFVEGVIYNIFSFDQWGVELGKEITDSLLTNSEDLQPDKSTIELIYMTKRTL